MSTPSADPVPPAAQARDARAAIYRAALLDVAEEIFAEHGYGGAAMKAVAAAGRVSLSTLYAHFDNKMALYRAVHARRLEALMGALRDTSVSPDDPVGAVLAGMRGYVRFHMEHPAYLRMHLREGMAWSAAAELRSPEQLEAWSRGLRRMARTFERGAAMGCFVAEDPELCARTVNAMHQVALSHWIDSGQREAPEDVLARLSRQFIRAFCEPAQVEALLAEHAP